MSDKVRRVDWSPDEWLSGTRGQLSPFEVGVYDFVLNTIYSRGGTCPDDATFVAYHFRPPSRGMARMAQQVRQALDQLIRLGKLKVITDRRDRWLTNGRATAELGRSRLRIDGARRAGIASGKSRRDNVTATSRQRRGDVPAASRHDPKSSDANGLDRTAVRNHQPSTIKEDREISTEAARASQPAASAGRAHGMRSTAEIVAELARKRRGGRA